VVSVRERAIQRERERKRFVVGVSARERDVLHHTCHDASVNAEWLRSMGLLRLVGSLKNRSLLQKSPTKETYKLQKRPII